MNQSPTSPYADLPDHAFWKTAVSTRSMFDISALWTPRFALDATTPVVTYGSCFAQHIGAALRQRGFNWLNMEPPAGDAPRTDPAFHYNVFSARIGNIYTTTLLRQWVRWAAGAATPPDEFWTCGDRIKDPFRPRIEPDGFASLAEAQRSRRVTLNSFADSIRRAQVFVFTLGLTERWHHLTEGYEYPLCPGTAAGTFDPTLHGFDTLGFADTLESLWDAIHLMRQINPDLRVLLTVSPVPLTATMSGDHVIPATTLSKSILRAVCGELARTLPHVDYFPAYEIISSPAFRGTFFAPNQRDVAAKGVDCVMQHFFDALDTSPAHAPAPPPPDPAHVICEEALLARAKGLH